MFCAIGKSSTRPAPLRSSGTRKMPASTASEEVAKCAACPLSAKPPPDGPVDAEQDPGEFGAPGADQARQSEDLAGVEVEVDVMGGIGGGAQAPDGDHDLATGLRRRHVVDLELPADHEPDHRVVVDVGALERAHQPAVAQHQDAVGGLNHLMQPVRDEDDRDAVRLEARRSPRAACRSRRSAGSRSARRG